MVVGFQTPEEAGERLGGVRAAADGKDADHLRSAAIDLLQGGRVERIAWPGDGGPQGAVLQVEAAGTQGLGDGRAGAQGVDDQVEAGAGGAIVAEQVAVVGAGDTPVGLEGDAGVEAGPVQDVEQGGAVDAEGLPGAMKVAVADVQNHAAGRMGAAEDVVDRLGEGRDGFDQVQTV